MYHKPVLLKESVDGLRISPAGTYADLTFGGGGHSKAILERLGPNGRLIAFDQDTDAFKNAPSDNRFVPVNANFRYLLQFLRYHKALPLDGILADLGVSSHQIDTPERGFTTRGDAPLDMRMDRAVGANASDMIASASEEELADTLYYYGELKNARRIAAAMVAERQTQTLDRVDVLRNVLAPFVPARHENRFMARVFQAFRIAVNDEIGALKEMLLQCPEAIGPGGRMVVISYHSLEDRLVKHFFRSGNFQDLPNKDFFGRVQTPFKAITSGALAPSEEEVQNNNRARSARLRIGERN